MSILPPPCAAKQEESELMRQSAYEELWKAEDDLRSLSSDLAQRNTKVWGWPRETQRCGEAFHCIVLLDNS